MKAIVKARPERGFDRREVDVPQIREGQVLVKVRATSLCGTDYHIYSWDDWAKSRLKLPRVVGHEFTGDVVELGAQTSTIREGERVAGESHIACGKCFQCKIGNRNICEDLAIIGVDVDGSFAEYVALPEENAWKVDSSLPQEVASILEPLGNAVHASLVTDITGNTVSVFGCGPAGLCAIAVAKASGATQILAVDINEFRLKLARKMGATDAYNGKTIDPVKEIMAATNLRGVDVVLEMSGSPVAVKQAFRALRNGGRVTLFGIPSNEIHLNLADEIIFKEARVFGIVGREMFRTWFKMEALLNSGKLNLEPLITHKMRLDDIEDAMELMASGNCGKIVMFP